MSMRDTLNSIGEAAWATFWGIKNSGKIRELRQDKRKCPDCDEDSSGAESYCSTHQKDYEELVQNGPYTDNPFS